MSTLWLFRYCKICLKWVIYFCYPNKFLEFVCIELNFWWFWYCKTFFLTSSDIRPKYLLNSCTSWWNFLQILWSKISIQSVLDQMRIRKITYSTVKQWKSKTAVLYTSNLDKSACSFDEEDATKMNVESPICLSSRHKVIIRYPFGPRVHTGNGSACIDRKWILMMAAIHDCGLSQVAER